MVWDNVSNLDETEFPQTMGASIHVPINPKLLVWARESSGYDTNDAASRLGVRQEKLESIEAGEAQITYAQLRKAAEVYKRSLAAFFMAVPPPSKEPPHDFRMQWDYASRPLSPSLNFELRKAWKHRDDVIELTQQMGRTIPVFEPTATMELAPEYLANDIRELLNISVQDQLSWRNSTIALKHWKAAVEACGVLVFEVSRIPIEEMRGASLWCDTLPVILLNGADSHTGRAFTLLHEFTHLLLRQGGICDLAPAEFESQDAKVEAFCNAVAGAALVPHDVLQKLLPVNHDAEWSMDELDELSRHFQVSKEVVLRRLLILGKTTDGHYQIGRASW